MVDDTSIAKSEEEKTQESSVAKSDQAPETSPLDEAKQILTETKETLAKITEERKKIEKAAGDLLVTGRSFAGQSQRVETEEEKWRREAKQRYAGTGMDPT